MTRMLPAVLMLLLAAGPSWAQSSTTDQALPSEQAPASGSGRSFFPVGLRAGYTSWEGYSQVHFGVHAKLGDLFPNVQLVPSLEAGFGDGLTLISANGDLTYRFTELVAFPWELYGGGCLALQYIEQDNIDSDFQLGISGLIGLSKALNSGNEVMVETRFGILDSPGFKLTFGYTFF